MTLFYPQFFPALVDEDDIFFVTLSEDDYRRESFLDNRVLLIKTNLHHISIKNTIDLNIPNHHINFIFHIGHCGSTLLSRLLGEHPSIFSIREPKLLRDLARGHLNPELPTKVLLALYSRVWREEQTSLVKATSFVSEIGGHLINQTHGRVLLLGVTPPNYLRGILSGPNSIEEARALAAERRTRLELRLGRPIEAHGDGELVALSWLCEMGSLQAIADAYPNLSLRLDFDRGLADPAPWIESALRHLGADPQAFDLPALITGEMMTRYAKAPEYAYDASVRAEVLAQAMSEKADEFRAGMNWLQRQAQADPRVARVLIGAAKTAHDQPK